MNPLPRWVTWFGGALAFLLLGAVEETRIEGFRVGHVRALGADVWVVSVDGWKPRALRAETTVAAMKDAQAKAAAAQEALNHQVAGQYRAAAEKTDEVYQGQLATLRAAAHAYARAHGVWANNRGAAGGSDQAPADRAPGNSYGPGADAVILTRSDFDILNENTARLQAVHDWGKGLIDAELAARSIDRVD